MKMLVLMLSLFLMIFGSFQNITPTNSAEVLSSSASLSSSSSSSSFSPSHSSSLPELTPSWKFVSRSLPSSSISGPVDPPSAISPTSSSVAAVASSVCGGVMTEKTGVIDEAGSPSFYKPCNWMIYSPVEDSTILLVFENHSVNCWNSWTSIRTWRQSKDLCQGGDPFAILALGRNVTVSLISYGSYFRLKAHYFVLNNTPEALHQPEWNVTVVNISSTEVELSWSWSNTDSSNSSSVFGYVATLHTLRNDILHTGDILLINVENASSSNTSSSFLSTVVRDLRPYTKYRVKVLALLRNRMTGKISPKSSTIVEVQTLESVPSAVQWLYAWDRDFNSLRIYWSSISSEEANGILLGYTVYYRPYNSNESFTNISVNINVNELTITGLKEATEYEIRVTGRTSVGEGAERSTYAQTECRQTFDKPSGELSVNSGFQFLYYRYCSWMIRSPVGNSSILLLFEEYLHNEDWIYIRSAREGKSLNSYQKLPLAVLVLDSFVTVQITKRSNNKLLKAQYFTMNNSRPDDPHQHDWNVTVSNVNLTAVDVSWSRLDNDNSNSTYIYGYLPTAHMIQYNTGDIFVLNVKNVSSENTSSSSLSTGLRGLRPYTKYRVKVVALVRDRITGAISSKSSAAVEVTTPEGVPSAVQWLYAWDRDFNSLRIEWVSISSEEANGILLGYTLYYRPYNSNESFANISVNSNVHAITITGLKRATRYEIKVTGRTSVGEGAERSTYAETGCGQYFDELSGQLTLDNKSNSGSEFYYHRYCHWVIRSPVVNSSILLLFEEYQHSNAWYWTYIWSMTDWKMLDKYQKMPLAVLVLDSYVTIYTYRYNTLLKFKYFIMNSSRSDALYQSGWNVTISNITSSAIGVRWPPLSIISSNATSLYGYVVSLRMVSNSMGTILVQEVANSTSFSTVVSGLRAYVKYRVEAVALLKDDVSGKISLKTSESVDIQTAEGAPFRGPWYNSVFALDYQSIFVSWYALPQEDSGGILRGYRVSYHDYGTQTKNVTVGPEQRQVILTDLEPGTYYIIYVSAFTAKGEGPRNSYGITTLCGALLSGHFGEISSPGFPHYIRRDGCVWNYTAPDNNSVLLISFQHFDLPFTWNCSRFYMEINKGLDVERICGRRDGLAIVWEGSSLHLRYHSQRWTSLATGFRAQYHTLNKSLTKAPHIQGWNITAESTSSKTVLVTWQNDNLVLSMKDIYGFVAACTATEIKDTLRLGAANHSSFRTLVQRLLPYTEYKVQVIALSKSQSNGSVSMGSSSVVVLRTKEDVPSKPPSNITAHGTNSTTIRVTWSPIIEPDIRGELQGYLVQYKEAWTQESYHNMSVGPLVSSVLLKGLKVFTQYRIYLAGFTKAGVGVQSRPHFPKTGCLFTVPSNVRDFASPNFPSNYPSNANCTWVIGQGMEFKETKMILFFDYFHTEGFGSPCSSDYVQVSDESQSIDWKFCGEQPPFALTFTESSFTVRLYSDNGIEEKGFYARYLLAKREIDLDIAIKEENTISASAVLEWKKTLNVGELKGYIVLYKLSQSSTYWNVIRTNDTRVSLKNIQPRTEYAVRVLLLAKSNVTSISHTFSFETGVVQTTGEPTNTASPTAEGPMQLMYPYGPSAGDLEIPNTYEYSWQCFKIDIPDDGMQFFGKRHYKVHICRNGLLQFDSQWLPWWPYNFGERWWLKKKAILAPYWCLTDTDDSFVNDGFSKVYYHVYSDSDPSSTPMLNRVSLETSKLLSTPLPTAFEASWALVVTWENLRPYQYPVNMVDQGNTFQLVLITNGVYSFTMYNYPSNGLQWSAPTQRMYYRYYSNARGLPVVGWNAGDKGGRKYNMPRSGTVNIETIDGIRGNADMVGKWLFRLEDSRGKLSARQECIDWFKAQPDPRFYTEGLEPCPCVLRQAWWDERFTVNWRDWPRMCGYAQFTPG